MRCQHRLRRSCCELRLRARISPDFIHLDGKKGWLGLAALHHASRDCLFSFCRVLVRNTISTRVSIYGTTRFLKIKNLWSVAEFHEAPWYQHVRNALNEAGNVAVSYGLIKSASAQPLSN